MWRRRSHGRLSMNDGKEFGVERSRSFPLHFLFPSPFSSFAPFLTPPSIPFPDSCCYRINIEPGSFYSTAGNSLLFEKTFFLHCKDVGRKKFFFLGGGILSERGEGKSFPAHLKTWYLYKECIAVDSAQQKVTIKRKCHFKEGKRAVKTVKMFLSVGIS